MCECPIGLICELMVCEPYVCQHYANPVPLPYTVWSYDYPYPKGTLISQLPDLVNENDDPLYELQWAANQNIWMGRVRQSMIEGGWGGYSMLPYYWDADQRCLEVTTSTPVLPDIEGSKTSEDYGFEVAVSISDCPKYYKPDIDSDGFWKSNLVWYMPF